MKKSPTNFRFDLNTHVITPDKRSLAVYAECDPTKNDPYIAYLSSAEGKTLGYISFYFNSGSRVVSNYEGIYRDKDNQLLPYIEVKYVENYDSAYSHVGTALQEYILRVSLESGYQGRVAFEAYKDSHYFHFKNGYRPCDHSADYYFQLAQKFYFAKGKKIDEQMGPQQLYLPLHSIRENLQKFKIVDKLIEDETETNKQLLQMQSGEALVLEAQQNSLVFKVLLAIQEYGSKEDMPKLEAESDDQEEFFLKSLLHSGEIDKYKKMNPALFCKNTEVILKHCHAMMKKLPMDPPQKLAIILIGTVITMMVLQHKLYGKETPYGNYPLEYDKLINDNLTIRDNILAIGKMALIDKTIPYSEKMITTLFPKLQQIPELNSFLQQAEEFYRAEHSPPVAKK